MQLRSSDAEEGSAFALCYSLLSSLLDREIFRWEYRIHSDFMSCGKPLLYEPPKDIKQWQYYYFIRPGGNPYGKKEKMTPKTAKREQFMICQITTRLNDAAIWYKNQTCEKGKANYDKSWIFHRSLDPNNNEGGEKKPAEW